jgi:uncharacterized membrane protein
MHWRRDCRSVNVQHNLALVNNHFVELEYFCRHISHSCQKMMWQADHSAMQSQAQKQDESKWVIMLLVILALLMCLIAIVMQLSSITKNTPFQYWHLGLSILTIISAWLFMHTAFALHYAHDFYMAF